MKKVLISIHPRWCKKIISGEKVLELRKSKPKLDLPFRCYIYCTKGTGKNTLNIPVTNKRFFEDYQKGSMACLNSPIGNGKVIGEFTCNFILNHCEMENADIAQMQSCVKTEEIKDYAGEKEVFGWRISDLTIYDDPKDLQDFNISRPPQSWSYL